MTKDTGDLRQHHAVARREYTLPREEASQPEGCFQGNMGPYWKLQLVMCMVSMELRSEFGL